MKKIASGIYPVMITPYTADNKIDFEAVDKLVEFYYESGCQGIFAVCQSSEMFFLSEDERVALADRVVKANQGRMTIVASGHISDNLEDQIRELRRIADTGVDGVVMVSNRLAAQEESDEILLENLKKILDALPDVTFGMYECPHPYKRLLSETVLEAMAASGRFAFIKDTCCDETLIAKRVQILNGRIQLFNANCATLLDTLKSGADGFSGIMANFHPDILVWLYNNYKTNPEAAERLMPVLSFLSCAEGQKYPTGCKYHMNLIGIPMTLLCRNRDSSDFGRLDERCIKDLRSTEDEIRRLIGLK